MHKNGKLLVLLAGFLLFLTLCSVFKDQQGITEHASQARIYENGVGMRAKEGLGKVVVERQLSPIAFITHAEKEDAHQNRTEVVIIFSQIRSGSSFVGELFNRKTGVTYIYEPLWQFPDHFEQEGVQVIDDIARCQFDGLASVYKRVYHSEDFLNSFFGR